jgi:hypothetical protein
MIQVHFYTIFDIHKRMRGARAEVDLEILPNKNANFEKQKKE